ncbi:MAG: Uncharacterized protein G01um10147_379 [Microgenomates group bacterium Gr01-1014_7]|nr:MAG: Uncharacterized protein G01um10147_379 [Microgenomates group bacterium Gr01-1014_7]
MNYITTTDLRTKSSELIETLKKGGSVSLIHRSKIVGEIKPAQEPKPLTKEGIARIKKLAKELNLPKLSYKERERRYRRHLMEKYGKDLS